MLLVVVLVAVAPSCGEVSRAEDPSASSPTFEPATTTPGTVVEPPDATTTTASTLPPTTLPLTTVPPATAPPPPPAGPGSRVVGIVDGDTLDVSSGERVRLIGIDTPEIGQCGYAEATATLRDLVGGRAVTLVPGARDDRDRYGRLLRYVEVDGTDVNLLMLLSGRAIARYDSRDGYGRHPREDRYVAADLANPSANVCGGAAAPTTVAGGAGGLDPRFGSCREAIAAGYGPYVAGVDPEYDWYRDGDGDGVNCE